MTTRDINISPLEVYIDTRVMQAQMQRRHIEKNPKERVVPRMSIFPVAHSPERFCPDGHVIDLTEHVVTTPDYAVQLVA